MKKIIFALLILISFGAKSQGNMLDTVFVRNLQLKGEEWWWGIKGINSENLDSIQFKWYNKVVKALKDANISSATNFTYDSFPGPFANIFFLDYWSHPEARENMGQGIDTKLRAYPPLAPYIADIDLARLTRFTNRKTNGKNKTN